ncbi:hypothetical protein [Vreelandella alkaliphila]|uniref:hypothetical protein n=1 Tax=Vreelandella alkaliphila TaxID=272774 RepID=UPI00192F629D|nr:hypothetical protein [Halomonas alkaliphila]
MSYQEKFLTIWDTPLKATDSSQQPAKLEAANKPPPSALKEVFLTIWDSTKSKTAS